MKKKSPPRTERGGRFAPVHGMRQTPEGNSWAAMMDRCFNENSTNYPRYGARGITACDFIKLRPQSLVSLIGNRPEGTSLDRKNNSLGYFCGTCEQCVKMGWPKNIRWADKFQQARNRSVCVMIGDKCASEVAEECGASPSTVTKRIQAGKSYQEITSPPYSPKLYTANGHQKTLREWSKVIGIKIKTLERRLSQGKTGERLIAPLNEAYRRDNYRTA